MSWWRIVSSLVSSLLHEFLMSAVDRYVVARIATLLCRLFYNADRVIESTIWTYEVIVRQSRCIQHIVCSAHSEPARLSDLVWNHSFVRPIPNQFVCSTLSASSHLFDFSLFDSFRIISPQQHHPSLWGPTYGILVATNHGRRKFENQTCSNINSFVTTPATSTRSSGYDSVSSGTKGKY